MELIYAENYDSIERAKSGIFEYIDIFYNRVRRHSVIHYVNPPQFERKMRITKCVLFMGKNTFSIIKEIVVSDRVFVSTKAELKKALEDKTKEILITDKSLANNIKVVSYASKAGLAAALAGTGIAAVNLWNPIGWGVAGVTAITSGTLIAAIVALGVGATLIWILWNDYDFSFEGGHEYTDPSGAKHKVYGKASFNKHKRK